LNLIIDQGNTLTKYAIFDQSKIVHFYTTQNLDEEQIRQSLRSFPIMHAFLSSVRTSGYDDWKKLEKYIPGALFFDTTIGLPFTNNYTTPQTQGKDRLAAVAGGIAIFGDDNILIVDAGTAITFEFITKGFVYKGGNISPGLSLRFKALNQFTSQLPLCTPNADAGFIGNSTREAITAGVQNSMIFEIDGYINELKSRYPSLKAAITGGDAEFFAGKLKNPIFVHQNLVLIGLNRILEYNV
jgi:type III pantothenate kinase